MFLVLHKSLKWREKKKKEERNRSSVIKCLLVKNLKLTREEEGEMEKT